jgi:hypothetical protein
MNPKPLIEPAPYTPPGGLVRYTNEEFENKEEHQRQSILAQLPARQNLNKQREEVERQQRELEAKEAAMLEKYNRLEALNRERSEILSEINYGQGLAADLQNNADCLDQTLCDWCFTGKHPNQRYQSAWGTMEIVSSALASERALKVYPAWLEGRQKKLAETEHEMKALAKELKLTDKLPPELRK